MIKPTIFLDIDGVLNSTRSMIAARQTKPLGGYETYEERHYHQLDPIAVGLLRSLVKETNARIVISSSWRRLYKSLEFFQHLFYKFDWYNAPVVGMTPITDSYFRGIEVQQYIDSDDFFNGKYIILDDDNDFFPTQPLIRVNGQNGFSYENYDEALRILVP